MPEILFKGKTHYNKWITGYYAEFKGQHYIITADEGLFANVVIPETVSMYTCRRDKNGRQIFAGDILRRYNGEIIVVCWSDCEAMFNALIYSDKKKTAFIGAAFLRDIQIEYYEVIGNRFDNPELIQEGAK